MVRRWLRVPKGGAESFGPCEWATVRESAFIVSHKELAPRWCAYVRKWERRRAAQRRLKEAHIDDLSRRL